LQALIAPRPLVVQTGAMDNVFSTRTPPYSSDYQVMRRSRAVWTQAEGAGLSHYLHYDVHSYHFGDLRAFDATGLGVTAAAPIVGSPATQAWETDGTTSVLSPTLFELIATQLQ
jgi:hypothetical protein